MSKCTKINGSGLNILLESDKSKNIQYIDVSCSTILDDGVIGIKQVESSLKKLKIYECGNVSRYAFEQLFLKDDSSNKEK